MTIDQFRSNSHLQVQWARELRTNGILQLVLEVMEENSPQNNGLTGDKNGDISPTRATLELGDVRGYNRYHKLLRYLSTPKVDLNKSLGQPTYEQPINQNA